MKCKVYKNCVLQKRPLPTFILEIGETILKLSIHCVLASLQCWIFNCHNMRHT